MVRVETFINDIKNVNSGVEIPIFPENCFNRKIVDVSTDVSQAAQSRNSECFFIRKRVILLF